MVAKFKYVSELSIGDLMVGEKGGTSTILELQQATFLPTHRVIITEHSNLTLPLNLKVIIKAD